MLTARIKSCWREARKCHELVAIRRQDSVIASYLGHESIEKTHFYLEADLATKQQALDKITPIRGKLARFQPDDKLLAFLAAL